LVVFVCDCKSTSILYLGALAIDTLLGGNNLHIIMIGLLLMAVLIGLGGMKVIGIPMLFRLPYLS
jgi:hypothetical protein